MINVIKYCGFTIVGTRTGKPAREFAYICQPRKSLRLHTTPTFSGRGAKKHAIQLCKDWIDRHLADLAKASIDKYQGLARKQ